MRFCGASIAYENGGFDRVVTAALDVDAHRRATLDMADLFWRIGEEFYRPEKAIDLLATAGFGDGTPTFKVKHNHSYTVWVTFSDFPPLSTWAIEVPRISFDVTDANPFPCVRVEYRLSPQYAKESPENAHRIGASLDALADDMRRSFNKS